ncbi:anti-sigma-K factor RskA [Neolewinella xylanilytica]|uniref:Anti-sigma-K factor RskA n=1 Tax=Neolewinella xylanilytica TaxID=1514080 RepID=A0A2S6I5D8_9BACT|nr:anti-sigma factor [Neolewinella xylanilytica]PPK86387.1 anti-sigma-K factor RskA [Neolewinella xylanilytica]
MDLTAYINSGVLELYVLDRLSPDERRRVEAYAADYPEVKAEIEQIELDLERYALLHGETTPPPPAMLEGLLREITPSAAAPAPASAPATTGGTPVPPAERGAGTAVWILVVALALALAGLVYFFLQNRDGREDLTELSNQFTALQAECQEVAQNYAADQQQIELLTDIGTRGIVLSGTDNAPESRARVFYNPDRESVLFTAANLPAPPAGRQYQLWAINAEGPQDLGVLDRALTGEELVSVPFVANTQAFAITLEQEGGQPTPDLTQLQVIGEVGS